MDRVAPNDSHLQKAAHVRVGLLSIGFCPNIVFNGYETIVHFGQLEVESPSRHISCEGSVLRINLPHFLIELAVRNER